MRKKLLFLLVVLLMMVSIFPANASAKNFYADETVNIEKNADETIFAAGNNVNVKALVLSYM